MSNPRATCPKCGKHQFRGSGTMLSCTNCGTMTTIETLCAAAYDAGAAAAFVEATDIPETVAKATKNKEKN